MRILRTLRRVFSRKSKLPLNPPPSPSPPSQCILSSPDIDPDADVLRHSPPSSQSRPSSPHSTHLNASSDPESPEELVTFDTPAPDVVQRVPSLRGSETDAEGIDLPTEVIERIVDHIASFVLWDRRTMQSFCARCFDGSRAMLPTCRYWLYHTVEITQDNWRSLWMCLMLCPENASLIRDVRFRGQGLVPNLHVIVTVLSHLISTGYEVYCIGRSRSLEISFLDMDLTSPCLPSFLALSQLPLVKRLSLRRVAFSSCAEFTKLLSSLRPRSMASTPLDLILEAISWQESHSPQSQPRSKRSYLSSLTIERTEQTVVREILNQIPINSSSPSLRKLVVRLSYESGVDVGVISAIANILNKSGPSLREFGLHVSVSPNEECLWLNQISLSSNTNLQKLTLRSLTSASLPLVVNALHSISSPHISSLDLFFSLFKPPRARRNNQHAKRRADAGSMPSCAHSQPAYWKAFNQALRDPKFDRLEYIYIDIRAHDATERDMETLSKFIPDVVDRKGFYYASHIVNAIPVEAELDEESDDGWFASESDYEWYLDGKAWRIRDRVYGEDGDGEIVSDSGCDVTERNDELEVPGADPTPALL